MMQREHPKLILCEEFERRDQVIYKALSIPTDLVGLMKSRVDDREENRASHFIVRRLFRQVSLAERAHGDRVRGGSARQRGRG